MGLKKFKRCFAIFLSHPPFVVSVCERSVGASDVVGPPSHLCIVRGSSTELQCFQLEEYIFLRTRG